MKYHEKLVCLNSGWFYDFVLKTGGQLKVFKVETREQLTLSVDWFNDFKLKCWGQLEMSEVGSLAVDFDLVLILWFWVEMLKKITDVTSVDIFYEDWFYDFELKCWRKLEMLEIDPINSGLWPWIKFMVLSGNVVIRRPTNNCAWLWINFKILSLNVKKIIWPWPGFILWFQFEILK